MQADLEPGFPLPHKGDRVQVAVTATALAASAPLSWCRVVRVDCGEYDLFPVTVRLPDGRMGAYQQHEIRGLQPRKVPSYYPRRALRWLLGRA